MLTPDLQTLAHRVAYAEEATSESSQLANDAQERLAGLIQRRNDIESQIRNIRANVAAPNMSNEDAARVMVLKMDADDLDGMIGKASSHANELSATVVSEAAALALARQDLATAQARAEIAAIEKECRKAEEALVRCVAEIARRKREAGITIRSGSDIFRFGSLMERFTRTGYVPSVKG